MKYLLLTLSFVLLASSALAANDSVKMWKRLSLQEKEGLLDAHFKFYQEYSIITKDELAQLTPRNHFWELINSAYAASSMDCVYAGWPSKRITGLCSTPVRHNPGYQRGSCQSNELQCQPMLFGPGFCVPTDTRKQRSLAFSNCTQKFAKSGRSIKDVILQIEKANKEAELFEVMNFSENTCTKGKQAATGMCKRLMQVVSNLKKHITPSEKKSKKEDVEKKIIPIAAPSEVEEKQITPSVTVKTEKSDPPSPLISKTEVIIEGRNEQNVEVKQDFIQTVEQVNKINNETNSTTMIMCEISVPFERTEPRAGSYSIGARYVDGKYEKLIFSDSSNNEYDKGVRITMFGPNKMAPTTDSGPSERQWDFISDDKALNSTYVQITDQPTPGTLSHLMETIYVLIPRKEIPRAETKGDEIHVTLPTGEMVIFDAKTKLIKKGAMSEKPIDINSNRFQRKFTTDYVGEGISIRVDRRGGDPRTGSGNVIITQKGKKCTLPKSHVWGGSQDRPKFKFYDDKQLVNELNAKCDVKFSI